MHTLVAPGRVPHRDVCLARSASKVVAAAERTISNLSFWGGAAAALIDPPMNSAPSATDTTDIPKFTAKISFCYE